MQRQLADDPGIFRPATLRRVDDKLTLGQRDPGESSRKHPDILAVIHGKRTEIGMPRSHPLFDEGRNRRELHDGLRYPATRICAQRLSQLLELGRAGGRTDDESLAAGAIHRFDDEFVEPIEHLRQRFRVFESPGVDVRDDRILAKVVPDEVGQVGVDELVIGNPIADRIGDGHIAEACREQQARAAEHRIRAKLQRIEKLVVDPTVNHIDTPWTGCGAHPYPSAGAEQVAAFDQLDTHQAGEQGVFEVGRVVDAGGEHNDGGVIRPLRCARAQSLQELVRIVANRTHPHAHEKFRKGLRHHSAVGDHVAHAARHAHVVFEHAPRALLIADEVDSGDLDAHAIGGVDAGSFAVEVAG